MRLLRSGFHFYIIGIIILTFGIALSILSTLGASPFDALLVGLYRTFGLTIGTWEIVVGGAMILGNAIAEKRSPEVLALLTSLITGIGIDSWMFLLGNVVLPTTWIGQTVSMTFGIIFIGLGVATYLQSSFALNPMDQSMLIITNITGWSITYSRVIINIILVVFAFIFSGDIGIGTLINALITGVLISIFMPFTERLKNKLGHDRFAQP